MQDFWKKWLVGGTAHISNIHGDLGRSTPNLDLSIGLLIGFLYNCFSNEYANGLTYKCSYINDDAHVPIIPVCNFTSIKW